MLQPEDTQVDTFEASSESLLKMAIQGKNTCAFTYGASGSGKTYTIMGGQGEHAGVLPRTVSALFNCLGDKLGTVAICKIHRPNFKGQTYIIYVYTISRVKAKSTKISFLVETYPDGDGWRSNQGLSERYGGELSAHKKPA